MLSQEEVEQLQKLLVKAVNGSERATENDLFGILTSMHPTLQQAYWRIHKNMIYRYADLPDHWFDARNEASHEWCKRVSGDIDKRPNFVALPTI